MSFQEEVITMGEKQTDCGCGCLNQSKKGSKASRPETDKSEKTKK
jgi:hypothetical protein